MNKPRNVSWTQIDIPGDDSGDDTSSFELDLNGEEPNDTKNTNKQIDDDEEALLNVRQENQDTRRPIISVQKNKENKDNASRAEVEEDQEERTVQNRQTRQLDSEEDEDVSSKRNSRAHKRIQTLLARERETQSLLAREREEKEQLRKALFAVKKQSVETNRDTYKNQLDAAEQELEKAIQENDAPRIAKLTKTIADSTMRYNAYQAASEEIEEPEEEPVRQQQVQPQGIEAAKSWLKRNPKFLQDKVFHVNARLISEEISNEGLLDPNDDEYWEELDKRLRKNLRIDDSQEEKRPPKRSSPVSSRNDEDQEDFSQVNQQFRRQGNKVQANPTQDDYEIAEKFNIKVEDLMKEKYKYAKQGYKGYVEIDIPGQPR